MLECFDPRDDGLFEQREVVRKQRDFSESDHLREESRQRGWQILDGKEGYEMKKS